MCRQQGWRKLAGTRSPGALALSLPSPADVLAALPAVRLSLSHTHESSLLGCIYQKVGWGQFVSGWPEKEATLNWVTVGVPANCGHPGLGERDRGQCLETRSRNFTLSFSISLCLSTNTCSVRGTGLTLSLCPGGQIQLGVEKWKLHYRQA